MNILGVPLFTSARLKAVAAGYLFLRREDMPPDAEPTTAFDHIFPDRTKEPRLICWRPEAHYMGVHDIQCYEGWEKRWGVAPRKEGKMPTDKDRTIVVSFELRDTRRTREEIKAKIQHDWAGPGIREQWDREKVMQIAMNVVKQSKPAKATKKGKGKR